MTDLIPAQPLSQRNLFATTCKLYSKCLLSSLPVSLIGVSLFVILLHLSALFPQFKQYSLSQWGMIGAILLLPLLGVVWLIMIQKAQNKDFHYGALLLQAYQRLLSLLGCFISLCFIPAFILGLFFTGYFLLIKFVIIPSGSHVPVLFTNPISVCTAKIVIGLILLASITTKLFGPVLVYSDQCDAEGSLDLSDTLVKNHFWITWIYHLYGIVILVFVYALPKLVASYFPQVTLSPLVLTGISVILVALLLPWTLSFWLVRVWELKTRSKPTP